MKRTVAFDVAAGFSCVSSSSSAAAMAAEDDGCEVKEIKNAPAFDFYPERWLAGTLSMSDAEQLAYLRLLCHQWLMDGLPDDPVALRRLAGNRGLTEVVLGKFPKGEGGRRWNRRLEEIRADQRQRMLETRFRNARVAWSRYHKGEPVPAHLVSIDAFKAWLTRGREDGTKGPKVFSGGISEGAAVPPEVASGALEVASGALEGTGGAPAGTSGAPADTGGAPADTSGAPASTSGAPAGCPPLTTHHSPFHSEIPTREEVLAFGGTIGCPPPACAAFWEKHEALGWMLNGSPIVKWRVLLTKWKTSWVTYNGARRQPGHGHGHGHGHGRPTSPTAYQPDKSGGNGWAELQTEIPDFAKDP